MMLALLAVVAAAAGALSAPDAVEIRHLVGEPDYRQVTLHWEASEETQPDSSSDPPTEDVTNNLTKPTAPFQVRYCELQAWGTQRCRARQVERDDGRLVTDGPNRAARLYTVQVDGLRMATTYSFEIKPARSAGRDDRSAGNENKIIVPTKGFSARATQCLPHASEIEVSTGPYFGGRIAVEAADGERCAADGQPQSPQDTYVLRIDHKRCGSYVNKTTVATYVLVQENLPILTHSTRRFLVLCTYQPETLTVRAGLSLPAGAAAPGAGSAAVAAPYDDEEYEPPRRSRHLRPAKLQAHPEPTPDTAGHTSPVAVVSLVVIAALCCITLAVFKWRRRRTAGLDNISIASNVSSSSGAQDLDNVSVISHNGAPLRPECPPKPSSKPNRY